MSNISSISSSFFNSKIDILGNQKSSPKARYTFKMRFLTTDSSRYRYNAAYLVASNKTKVYKKQISNEDIILIYQFFIHSNEERNKELQFCLKKNVENRFISKIYLINERTYTNKELGTNSNKIVQVIKGSRMNFSDTLSLVKNMKLRGYIITGNADIFYDETINLTRYTNLSNSRLIYNQLRLEYNGEKNLKLCKAYRDGAFYKETYLVNIPYVKNLIKKNNLFCPWSADTWILHSNLIRSLSTDELCLFSIPFGIPGIDNLVPHRFHELDCEIRNEPFLFRCYHFHTTNIRNYDEEKDRIISDKFLIFPTK